MLLTLRFTQRIFLVLASLFLVFMVWKNWASAIELMLSTQFSLHQLLSDHIRQFNTRPYYHGAWLLFISLAYGVFHAVGPGHGKAVLVTYLTTHNESVRQGIKISFAAAVMQSLVAIGLVAVVSVFLNQTFAITKQAGVQAEQVSYLMIIMFGGYLFFQASRKIYIQLKPAQHENLPDQANEKHSHNHHHHPHNHHQHSSEADCCHTYVPKAKTSVWQSIGIVLSMGIRPCSGAIIVLMYANLVSNFWMGVTATFVMGLGTGFSISIIGFIALHFRDRLLGLVNKTPKASHHFALAPVWRLLGSLFIMSLGWSLFMAAHQVSQSHPLF